MQLLELPPQRERAVDVLALAGTRVEQRGALCRLPWILHLDQFLVGIGVDEREVERAFLLPAVPVAGLDDVGRTEQHVLGTQHADRGIGARHAVAADLERLERRTGEALARRRELDVLVIEDHETVAWLLAEFEQPSKALARLRALAQRADVDDDRVELRQVADREVDVAEPRPVQAEATGT